MEETKPFSWTPQAQPAWSFINAETQQPAGSQDVFGKPAASNTFSSFAGQTAFGAPTNGIARSDAHNFTIQPSQVEQSLSNSFGQSQGYEQPHAQQAFEQPSFLQHEQLQILTVEDECAQEHSPDPPQPNSYTQSQAAPEEISLVSDDEEEDSHPAYTQQFAQQSMTNGIEGQTDDEDEILDDAADDEIPDSYQHTNPYATNPYAALANDFGAGDTEEDADEEQGSEGSEGAFEDDISQDQVQPNGYYVQNGYANEEESDGDIEDAEDYDDEEPAEEDEGVAGSRAFQRFTNGNAEESDEEEYDEDETEGSEYQNSHVWNQEPPKNEALQGVGATEEEAIELSD